MSAKVSVSGDANSINDFSCDPFSTRKYTDYVRPANTPRFDWISDRQNEIAQIIAVIALSAIAATGVGLMAEGTFFAVGALIVMGSPFVALLGVIFNEVVKGIWNKSLMTFN